MVKIKAKRPSDLPEVSTAANRSDMLSARDAQSKALFASIEKKFGEGVIGRASQVTERAIARLPTGVFSLDAALGGGWPRSRISIVWGIQSSGKTFLMIKMIAEAQKLDKVTNKFLWEVENPQRYRIGFIDVEGAFDFNWAEHHGVDLDLLDYARPDSAEQAGNMIESMVSSGIYDIIILDSLAAMTPEKELEGEVGDHNVGVGARINNQMFRKLQSHMNRLGQTGTAPTIFIINQERQKMTLFGDPRVKPGGLGQNFFCSVDVHTSQGKMDYYDGKEKTKPKWQEFNFFIDKNKTAIPKVSGSYTLSAVDDPDGGFLRGEILEQDAVLNYAERLGVMKKIDATTWRMKGKTFKKKGDMLNHFFGDPDAYSDLKRFLLSKLYPKAFQDVVPVETPEATGPAETVADEKVS